MQFAVSTCRYHNQETYALFVDLVKAFDTINHKLMIALLKRYGAPDSLANAIEQLYKDMSVKLTVEKKTAHIPYTVGVQQGDSMVPILFLFVMQALSETMENKWDEHLSKLEYRCLPTADGKTTRGRLLSQRISRKGTSFNLFYQLYVDDGALLFATKEDLEKTARFMHAHFSKFGLTMHIGKDGSKSKTKAMHFPASLQKTLYTVNLGEKRPVADGYITWTKTVPYLGSWISDDLKDDNEVETHVKKAYSQAGALRSFFRCPYVSLIAK